MPKLIDMLRDIAPAIGTAMTVFGGPLGAAGATVLTQALDLPESADDKTILSALQGATPEQIAAVRKIDADFRIQMAQVDLQQYQATLGDIANARAREIAVGGHAVVALAAVITVGFFMVLMYMLRNGIPTEGGEALLVMIGSLGTAWTGVVAYYFGSSAGSKAKTHLMSNKKS